MLDLTDPDLITHIRNIYAENESRTNFIIIKASLYDRDFVLENFKKTLLLFDFNYELVKIDELFKMYCKQIGYEHEGIIYNPLDDKEIILSLFISSKYISTFPCFSFCSFFVTIILKHNGFSGTKIFSYFKMSPFFKIIRPSILRRISVYPQTIYIFAIPDKSPNIYLPKLVVWPL